MTLFWLVGLGGLFVFAIFEKFIHEYFPPSLSSNSSMCPLLNLQFMISSSVVIVACTCKKCILCVCRHTTN